MKNNNLSSLFESQKEIRMTDQEKKTTWDGVLRRASDYSDGVSPFANKENNWDGALRRKADFPEGVFPHESKDSGSVRKSESSRQYYRGLLPALRNGSKLSQFGKYVLGAFAAILVILGIIALTQNP